jgi:hypothetical protein
MLAYIESLVPNPLVLAIKLATNTIYRDPGKLTECSDQHY